MQSLELTILSVGVTSIGWGIAHGFCSSESSESVEEGGGDSEGVGEGARDESGDCGGEGDGDREREGNEGKDRGREGLGSGGNRRVSFDMSAGRSTSLSGILGGVEGDGNKVGGSSKERACGVEESGGGGSEDGSFDVSAGRFASLSGISGGVEGSLVSLALERVLYGLTGDGIGSVIPSEFFSKP
ncbi:hypothetical protein M0802_014803 [Mischocyttarus mexicanus]|nr:hypothetical protein M0802_014803 [Mischocyttarus mexicanus]